MDETTSMSGAADLFDLLNQEAATVAGAILRTTAPRDEEQLGLEMLLEETA